MDSGVENLNGTVDTLFDGDALRRVIAQIDVTFSNSLIEAWWRVLKHQPGDFEKARRVLCDAAQPDDAPQRVQKPDA